MPLRLLTTGGKSISVLPRQRSPSVAWLRGPRYDHLDGHSRVTNRGSPGVSRRRYHLPERLSQKRQLLRPEFQAIEIHHSQIRGVPQRLAPPRAVVCEELSKKLMF